MKFSKIALVSLCSLASANVYGRDLTAREISLIKSAVLNKLKDPESARFRLPKDAPTRGVTYCGEYNAKNSFGGYVGFQWFVAYLDLNNGSVSSVITVATGGPARIYCLEERYR